MAKAHYAAMFETVSGALKRINKKSPHAGDQKMVLTTHRVAPTTNPECSRVYLRGLNAVSRSTALSAREIAVHARFSAIATAVNARVKAASPADLEAFRAQRKQADGKQTLRSYLWAIEAEAYDNNQ